MTTTRRNQLGQLAGRLAKGTLRTDERTLCSHAGDKWHAAQHQSRRGDSPLRQ